MLSIAVNSVATEQPPASHSTTADFTVTLDSPNSGPVTVDYATRDGTGKAGVDYSPVQGTVVFAPGVTAQTIQVPVTSSATSAPNPTFYVALSNPVNDSLSPTSSVGAGLILTPPPTTTALSATPANASPEPSTTTPSPANATPAPTPIPVTATPAATPSTAHPTPAATPSAATPSAAPAPSPTAGTTPPTPPALPTVSTPPTPATTAHATPSPTATPGTPTPAGVSRSAPPAPAAPAASAVAAATPAANPLVVTNTNDSGPGSLRNALQSAQTGAGNPVITFAIPGTGPVVIQPLSPLPTVTRPLTINATSQPGYHGAPVVTINGARAGGGANGLVITGGGTRVDGLAIGGFSGAGIVLRGLGGNTIAGDDLGTDASGKPGLGNTGDGIRIESAHNTVGGTAAGAADVIAGNGLVGVRVAGSAATNNVIQGNLIGTRPDGVSALGNQTDGVFIDGAAGNVVGGLAPAARNVISGNRSVGVQIDGIGASANQIVGNEIGTDASGTRPIGNGRDGVFVDNAPANSVGGTAAGAGNLIAANAQVGLQLFGRGAHGNVIQGNRIGQGPGSRALGNAVGLFVNDAPGNTIGGPGNAANVIAGNSHADVLPAGVLKASTRHPAPRPGQHPARSQGGVHLGPLDLSSLVGTGAKSIGSHSANVTSQALSLLRRLGNQTQGSGS